MRRTKFVRQAPRYCVHCSSMNFKRTTPCQKWQGVFVSPRLSTFMPKRLQPPCPICKRLPPCSCKKSENRRQNKNQQYGRRWREGLRKQQLAKEPCCRMCEKEEGVVRAAVLVDHVQPHRGLDLLFNDPKNLQSLCRKHHDIKTQIEGL